MLSRLTTSPTKRLMSIWDAEQRKLKASETATKNQKSKKTKPETNKKRQSSSKKLKGDRDEMKAAESNDSHSEGKSNQNTPKRRTEKQKKPETRRYQDKIRQNLIMGKATTNRHKMMAVESNDTCIQVTCNKNKKGNPTRRK
jgi:phage-related minor tail protein